MEQKLIDLLFEMVMTAAFNPWFNDKDQEQVAEWVRKQLKDNGINVIPVGSSHGILKRGYFAQSVEATGLDPEK